MSYSFNLEVLWLSILTKAHSNTINYFGRNEDSNNLREKKAPRHNNAKKLFLSESGFAGLEDFQDKVKVKTLVLIVGFNPENSQIL